MIYEKRGEKRGPKFVKLQHAGGVSGRGREIAGRKGGKKSSPSAPPRNRQEKKPAIVLAKQRRGEVRAPRGKEGTGSRGGKRREDALRPKGKKGGLVFGGNLGQKTVKEE